MNPIIDLLKQAEGTIFVNEDGLKTPFQLLPPLDHKELDELQAQIPCSLPDDMLELLQCARGFTGGPLELVEFAGMTSGFGLEDIFPCPIPLATDGFGNFWIVDLTSGSKTWAPIYYACHDAPVILYQTDSLAHFVEEVLHFGNRPWESEIDDVHEQLSDRVWSENPGILSFSDCLNGKDPDLTAFASSLDETREFSDLRLPKIGDGFSWGRYGPKTVNRRFGEKRICARQKKTFGQRLLDSLR
jgi:hypothetical protein